MRRGLPKKLLVLFVFILLSISVSLAEVGSKNDTVFNDSEVLLDDFAIFLRVGETWNFYQGYSIGLSDVSDDGLHAWLQLSQDNVFVEDAIVTRGSVFTYTKHTDGKNVTVLRVVVEDIYTNPTGYLVTLSPVTQYFDPTLPFKTPVSANATVTTTGSPAELPPVAQKEHSLLLVLFALIVLVLTFYMMKRI